MVQHSSTKRFFWVRALLWAWFDIMMMKNYDIAIHIQVLCVCLCLFVLTLPHVLRTWAVCALVPRLTAREHPEVDVEGMAYGASQDPHLCPWRSSKLWAAPAHQAGGGQRPNQSCSHHRGLDSHWRRQHRYVVKDFCWNGSFSTMFPLLLCLESFREYNKNVFVKEMGSLWDYTRIYWSIWSWFQLLS